MHYKVHRTKIFLMSTAALYGTAAMFKGAENEYTISNSIFSVLLFIVIYMVVRKADAYCDKWLVLCTTPLAIFFSACLVLGNNLLFEGFTNIHLLQTWLQTAGGAVFVSSILRILFVKLPELYSRLESEPPEKSSPVPYDMRLILRDWTLIFIAWLPAFLASFPGIYGYDSVYQTGYYVRDSISLHHPLAHTYLLGFCVVTLGKFLGSIEIGMAVYSIVQMLLLSLAFAFSCGFLRKIHLPEIIREAVLIFYMFLPTHAIMSFSSTKDILYSALFVAVLVCVAQIVFESTILLDMRFLILFSFVCFMNAIFRNQGIYVLIPALLIGVFLLSGCRKRLLGVLFCLFVSFAIYSGPITKLAGGVEADPIREMVSVPVVQLSRTAVYVPEDLTEDEMTTIANYIPNYEKYPGEQGISDVMKNSFRSDLFRENPQEFIGLWIRVGLKCPAAYFDAFARLCIGLWYPDMNEPDSEAYHPYWEYHSSIQREPEWIIPQRTALKGFEKLSDYYANMTYNNSYQKIPVISMLYSSGFYVWMMLILITYICYIREVELLFPVSFVFFLWLTLLLGPVVLYRYVYPIVAVMPILIGILVMAVRRKISEQT